MVSLAVLLLRRSDLDLMSASDVAKLNALLPFNVKGQITVVLDEEAVARLKRRPTLPISAVPGARIGPPGFKA